MGPETGGPAREAAHAQAHPLGQLFLGQARGESVTLEECRWDALVSQLEQVTVVFEGVTPALIGHLDCNEHLPKPALTVSGRAGWPDRTPRPDSMHVYMVS
jgi:hypothetical protein